MAYWNLRLHKSGAKQLHLWSTRHHSPEMISRMNYTNFSKVAKPAIEKGQCMGLAGGVETDTRIKKEGTEK
jgi:hypothetical protein